MEWSHLCSLRSNRRALESEGFYSLEAQKDAGWSSLRADSGQGLMDGSFLWQQERLLGDLPGVQDLLFYTRTSACSDEIRSVKTAQISHCGLLSLITATTHFDKDFCL